MKNSPYFTIIIVAIVCCLLGYLIPKTPYFTNKELNKLKSDNDSLHKEMNKRNKENEGYIALFKKEQEKNITLENIANNRDIHIKSLEHKIDSISVLINISDTTLIKIKNQGYEEINNVNNWNANQRILFFTDYFKDYNRATKGN